MPDIVVLDTNIWISALLRRGTSHAVIRLVRQRIVRTAYCDQMLAELAGKLRDKFSFSESRIHAVVYELRNLGIRIEISGAIRVIVDDADDDKFVECAILSKAKYIVSNDRHPLALGSHNTIEIITASAFINQYDNAT